MSAYTQITAREMEQFMQRYPCGALVSHKGISEGIENTNYFVDTAQGSYVLTVFEWLGRDELPWFIDLMAHVADAGLPCPHPVAARDGGYLQELKGKPAVLITRLRGRTVRDPDARHCGLVGEALARLHGAMKNFGRRRENGRDIAWFREQGRRLDEHLGARERELLRSEIKHQAACDFSPLPGGIIHADLFRDNVMFDGPRLSGLIDFYYACEGSLLYDLAVTVNDWCRCDGGAIAGDRYEALLAGYRKHRALQPAEARAWQDALRRAALRFWLSRLRDRRFPRRGEITHIKDPGVFHDILLDCRAGGAPLA